MKGGRRRDEVASRLKRQTFSHPRACRLRSLRSTLSYLVSAAPSASTSSQQRVDLTSPSSLTLPSLPFTRFLSSRSPALESTRHGSSRFRQAHYDRPARPLCRYSASPSQVSLLPRLREVLGVLILLFPTDSTVRAPCKRVPASTATRWRGVRRQIVSNWRRKRAKPWTRN